MQQLWLTKVGWDDALPEAIIDKWKDFQEGLREMTTLRVPRLVISPSRHNRFFIQGFCDASESAYGACIYIQTLNECGDVVTVKLLCSKARVAPLRRTSISRLELYSALLLAELIKNVKRALRIRVNGIQAWSDSTASLAPWRYDKVEALRVKSGIKYCRDSTCGTLESHSRYRESR